MKKPTLEEVREYFKDAKVVRNNIQTFQINDIKNIINGLVVDSDYFYKDEISGIKSAVWEDHTGYAKILEYKPKNNTTMKHQFKLIFETPSGNKVTLEGSNLDNLKAEADNILKDY